MEYSVVFITYFVIFQLKVGDKQLICCEWNDSRICNEARGSYIRTDTMPVCLYKVLVRNTAT